MERERREKSARHKLCDIIPISIYMPYKNKKTKKRNKVKQSLSFSVVWDINIILFLLTINEHTHMLQQHMNEWAAKKTYEKLRNKPTSSEIPSVFFSSFLFAARRWGRKFSLLPFFIFFPSPFCYSMVMMAFSSSFAINVLVEREIEVNENRLRMREFNEAYILSPKREITVPFFLAFLFFCFIPLLFFILFAHHKDLFFCPLAK